MNKTVVMNAIADRMNWIFNKVICNPKNEGKDLTRFKTEIKDLYEAYMELRGHSGYVAYVNGVDSQAGNVVSIYELVIGG